MSVHYKCINGGPVRAGFFSFLFCERKEEARTVKGVGILPELTLPPVIVQSVLSVGPHSVYRTQIGPPWKCSRLNSYKCCVFLV
jgi:hypothetical protein